MITKIELENFKCFDSLELPLKNVTVLTGINGMGKSTVIQALLLLRQSYLADGYVRGLHINGKYADLGTSGDILYEKAETEEVGIEYEVDNTTKYKYRFGYAIESDFMPLKSSSIEAYGASDGDSLSGDHFVYLSAYRIKPQEMYRIINEEDIEKKDFGNNGEYAIQYLSLYGNTELENKSVIREETGGNSLLEQTKSWLDRIAPGVSPKILLNPQVRTSELRYEFIEGKTKTNSYRSVNVGFGITYVLPLIVAILSAKPGDILVLENPEAHIHPSGQRMLGELIALAGNGGVQVIVETHSDHILNGIRIAVKKKEIAKERVQLAFFYKDTSDEYRHKYVTPQIQDDGRLDIWPEFFFDEWDKALYELM